MGRISRTFFIKMFVLHFHRVQLDTWELLRIDVEVLGKHIELKGKTDINITLGSVTWFAAIGLLWFWNDQ